MPGQMGYELHITRRSDWFQSDGPAISQSEWQKAIDGNPESGAFYWNDGDVVVKNPDPPLVAKMVHIAQTLNARVQGDDGEVYRADGTSFDPSPAIQNRVRQRLFQRLARFLRGATPKPSSPFYVGQRVKDFIGGFGTVVSVDPKSHGKLGSIIVKMDDGREQHRTCVASGFEPMA